MTHSFPVALAPLAGVTDMAFRQICKRFGADVVTTEMISAKGLYYRDKKTEKLLRFSAEEQPLGIQLFGSDPEVMAYAAAKVAERGPAFLDLNMGCPVPKIFCNGDGSALMKDPVLAGKVVEAVVRSVSVPVTVKFRAGVDSSHRNAVEFARVCEASGASALTIHGRTRDQFYSGKADREIIAEVCRAVHIFVYGNGDVFTPEDAMALKNETGCDGIMVARGALGNPFLFEQIKSYRETGTYRIPTNRERLEVAKEQVMRMCEEKGEWLAIPEARKHVAWYLKGMYGAAECKNAVFGARTYRELKEILDRFMEIQTGGEDGGKEGGRQTTASGA